MRGKFVFPALLCLLVVLIFQSAHPMLFILLWGVLLFRCRYLNFFPVFFVSCLLSILTSIFVLTHQQQNRTKIDPQEERFLLEVDAASIRINGDRVQFYGRTVKEKERMTVFYTLDSQEEKEVWGQVQTASYYFVEGDLDFPEPPTSPHEFNYAAFLKQQRVHWTLEARRVERKGQAAALFPNIKNAALSHIQRQFSGKTGEYIKALFFSDKRQMGTEMIENFRRLGLIHLLSISGLHIHLLAGMIERLLWRAGMTRERTVLLVLSFLGFYGFLLEWSTSVCRAVFQICTAKISETKNLRLESLDNWSIALILSLWIDPFKAGDAGFQLSFGLSFILIFLGQSLWFRKISPFRQSLWSSFLLFLFSVPILTYHFFEFPMISLFLNMLVIPFFSIVILPFLLLLFLLSYFPLPPSLFLKTVLFSDHFFNFTEKAISKGALHFSGTFTSGRLPWWGMSLLVFSLLILFISFEKPTRRPKIPLITCILFIGALNSQRYLPYGQVIMLDIGQGDAILIKEAWGRGTYLLDTGGQYTFKKEKWRERETPYSMAESVLLPFLKYHGIQKLDQVLLTHSHEDHTGNLRDILPFIKIRTAIAPLGTWKNEKMRETLKELISQETEILAVNQKDPLMHAGPGLAVLWPDGEGDGQNDDSLVLYGKIGQHIWLFTGDIEEKAEEKLIHTYPNLQADILKVAHHGSQTSTTENFIDQVRPQYALISSGKKNVYGHPHPTVTQRLEKGKIRTYNTAVDGTITYRYTVSNSNWKPAIKTRTAKSVKTVREEETD